MTAEPADPFASSTDAMDDLDDPFATADEAKSGGGKFTPWPRIEALRDRLIVLVPREFDKEAPVSEYLQKEFNLGKTREEWKTDLVILASGGDFSYEYRGKVKDEDKANPDGPDEYAEMTWTVTADQLPYLIPGWKASWGNIIGALNAITKAGKPMAFGRIRAGYAIATMRKGKTFEDFRAEEEAYYAALAANPRAKLEKPATRWHFEVSEDPKDKALGLAWWKAARADGYTLNS
ncbi:MAG TPA: hypothetical protein VL595_16510 [Pseudonocardia sp.]|nr:hypothetical protein [Pseudonocardia sp.]